MHDRAHILHVVSTAGVPFTIKTALRALRLQASPLLLNAPISTRARGGVGCRVRATCGVSSGFFCVVSSILYAHHYEQTGCVISRIPPTVTSETSLAGTLGRRVSYSGFEEKAKMSLEEWKERAVSPGVHSIPVRVDTEGYSAACVEP